MVPGVCVCCVLAGRIVKSDKFIQARGLVPHILLKLCCVFVQSIPVCGRLTRLYMPRFGDCERESAPHRKWNVLGHGVYPKRPPFRTLPTQKMALTSVQLYTNLKSAPCRDARLPPQPSKGMPACLFLHT